MRCRKCGLEVDNDKAFCPVCGTPLKVTADYDYIQAEIANKVDKYFNEDKDGSEPVSEKAKESRKDGGNEEESVTRTRTIYDSDSIFDEDPDLEGGYIPDNEEEYTKDKDVYAGIPEEAPQRPVRERPRYQSGRRPSSSYPQKRRTAKKNQTAARLITALVILVILAAAAMGIMAILGVFGGNKNQGPERTVQNTIPLTCNLENGATYEEPIEVILENSNPGNVFYTLDGSEPSLHSRIYSGPFTISPSDVASTYPNVNLKAVSYTEDSQKAGELSVVFSMKFDESVAASLKKEQEEATQPKPEEKGLASPQISPVSGTYNEETLITLTSEDGADIYYTLNGTIPSLNSSLYRGSFNMRPGSSTLNAICIRDGEESQVASANYNLDFGYPVSADDALNNAYEALLGYGFIYDYNGTTDDGYADVYLSEMLSMDGYTYYIVEADFYTEETVLRDSLYAGVGVNYGGITWFGKDGDFYYYQ